jgi:hypothetical protein
VLGGLNSTLTFLSRTSFRSSGGNPSTGAVEVNSLPSVVLPWIRDESFWTAISLTWPACTRSMKSL